MAKTVTITFAENEIKVPLGDTGRFTVIRLADMPDETFRYAALQGFIGALNNISRGKDENGAANSDDVWAAAREKRVRPWMQGQWGSVERESAIAPLKEALIADMRANYPAHFTSDAKVEKHFADLVKVTFGDKEKATFARWLDALAKQVADQRGEPLDEVRAKLEAKYEGLAKAAAEARAKAEKKTATLDFSAIQL